MGHWNYRIVKYKDGTGMGLHEVYYDNDGLPWSMTSKPVTFTCDTDEGPDEIIKDLLLARVSARKKGVFDEPKKWPGKNPGSDFKLRAS